jgi:hypothetical protein
VMTRPAFKRAFDEEQAGRARQWTTDLQFNHGSFTFSDNN